MSIEDIRRLVGEVTEEQLRFVDCFVSDRIALFMPACGACFYALTPLHSHPSYMFILAFDARTTIAIDGRKFPSRPGKLMALSPNIVHHELPSDYPPRYIAVFIEREFFEARLASYPVRRDFFFAGEHYEPGPDILPLFKRFMAEASVALPGSRDVLQALGIQLCHAMIRSILQIASPSATLSSRFEIDKVIEYMHEHMGEKLTLKDMAKVASMSPWHFSRIFKKETGASVSEYLDRIRLEKARRLLLDDDTTITDIALECGFGGVSYFSSRFSKKYAIAPSKYRISLKKGIISKENRKIVNDSLPGNST